MIQNPLAPSFQNHFCWFLILLCTISCCIGTVSAGPIAGMMEIPERASAGQAVAIIDYISSFGSEPYGPFVLEYHLSKEPYLTPDAIYVGNHPVQQLPPLSQQQAPVALMIPASIPEGPYYIIRSENGEVYGTSYSTIFISGGAPLAPAQPDSNIPVAPAPPAPPGVSFAPLQGPVEFYIGESFPIIDAIQNSDTQTAKLVDVTYSLIRNPATLKGKQIGSWKVLSLNPGDRRHNEKMVSGSGFVPGYYYLMRDAKLTGSPGVTLLEQKTISPNPILAVYNPRGPYPDLTQVKTAFPTQPTPGSAVEVIDIITNIGNVCAYDVVVAYYASPLPTFDPAGALLLGHSRIPQICPGEQITVVTGFTMPEIIFSGTYYLYSVLDPCTFIVSSCAEILPELRKDNNINGGTIKAGGHCFIGKCVFSNPRQDEISPSKPTSKPTSKPPSKPTSSHLSAPQPSTSQIFASELTVSEVSVSEDIFGYMSTTLLLDPMNTTHNSPP